MNAKVWLAAEVYFWATLTLGLMVEALCIVMNWPRITDVIRQINQKSGWLVALITGSLWIHFFFVPWFLRLADRILR